jgi:ribonucleoside-diphosphate reductase beta chain
MADTSNEQSQGILGTGLRDGLQLKPIRYQWAYDLYTQAVANTWFPNEVQLVQDLADFDKLTEEEKHALKTVISYLNTNELLSVFTHTLMQPKPTFIFQNKCGKNLTTS